MIDRMIRLVASDNLGVPRCRDCAIDYINVIREDYSEELMAYFIRSVSGTLLVVNAKLPIEVQAKAISFVKHQIEKCGVADTGVLKKNFEYFCGGPCCRDKYNSSVV